MATQKKEELKQKRSYKLIVIAVIALLVTGGWFAYQQTLAGQAPRTPGEQTNQPEGSNDEIIQKVARLVALPQDEQPTIATVTDIEKLKDQSFFTKAKNGDKVLVYQKARKAYLYDPLADKLIDIAPIASNSATNSAVTQ